MQFLDALGMAILMTVSLMVFMEVVPINLIVNMYAGREGNIVCWVTSFVFLFFGALCNFGNPEQ